MTYHDHAAMKAHRFDEGDAVGSQPMIDLLIA